YQIRFKETDNYNAGAFTEVDVPESGVSSYNLTVNGGTGEGVFNEGASVTITAYEPATGKKFSGWTIEGISGLDTTKTSLTFNMPANAVTATANYEDIEYTITVNGGTANKEKAIYDETVRIDATVPTGKKFVEWTCKTAGVTIEFASATSKETTLVMPAAGVTVEATFEDETYSITVTDGTTTLSKATYQTEVTVKANEPATDMYFDKWEVTGLDTTDMDLTKAEIKFNMPAKNVTFKATYLAVRKYDIVVVDGTKDISPAKAGETVTITANPAPSGKVFDKWTCETAGVTIEFASATSKQTTFVMPASNVKIQAHFRDIEAAPSIEIKVNGGTGAGTYKQGDSVTVTADAPSAGKVFKGWKDGSGKIVSTNKNYTFTVDGEISLTAVYDNAAAAGSGKGGSGKQGGTLSGGKVAGIVIGVLAAVGAATAAVVIVIKKKRK
ncbi:MAG: InlB B-repeat-containing protein, partial [Firmicutes bacterium]|nr:InlB B-repeat-containing protein [Bacillota bacterium]